MSRGSTTSESATLPERSGGPTEFFWSFASATVVGSTLLYWEKIMCRRRPKFRRSPFSYGLPERDERIERLKTNCSMTFGLRRMPRDCDILPAINQRCSRGISTSFAGVAIIILIFCERSADAGALAKHRCRHSLTHTPRRARSSSCTAMAVRMFLKRELTEVGDDDICTVRPEVHAVIASSNANHKSEPPGTPCFHPDEGVFEDDGASR